MIKYFCDCCGDEVVKGKNDVPWDASNGNSRLTGHLHGRVPGEDGMHAHRLKFEVTTGRDDTWNAGEWCKYCIIDAVKTLDDRPVAEVAPSLKSFGAQELIDALSDHGYRCVPGGDHVKCQKCGLYPGQTCSRIPCART